jgi:putative DNA primase/helicase
MERAADRLLLAGRIVRRTGGPPGDCKDIDEALGRHRIEELQAWIAAAQPAELSLDGHARKCARIRDPLRCGQTVTNVIKQFELRKEGLTTAFREEVAKYAGTQPDQDADEEPEAKGAALDVADVIPWPHPVDGAAVLDQVVELLCAYIVMQPWQAHLIVLWCAVAHGLDCFYFNPRLAIRSPSKRCGKTTLIDIISGLVPRALPAANITEAAVFRTIEAAKPTLLIDEADCLIDEKPALRSVLNSGHVRTSAHVIRVVPTATGEQEPRKFSTWAPIATALIGNLPDTLADRSIDIALQRKPRGTRVRRLRKDRGMELPALQRQLARFVADHRLALEQADPEPPEALNDRMADNLRPVMAVAEVAGGDWPERARAAALQLNDVDDDNEDYGVQLLADIRSTFEQRATDRIWTDELLAALLAMRERARARATRCARPSAGTRRRPSQVRRSRRRRSTPLPCARCAVPPTATPTPCPGQAN